MAGSVVQVFVFPVLQRRFNNVRLYRALMLLWPILFAILPFLHILARWSAPASAFASKAIDFNSGAAGIADGADTLEVIGEFVSDVASYPAGPLLWIGIGIALAILRLGHMCYS